MFAARQWGHAMGTQGDITAAQRKRLEWAARDPRGRLQPVTEGFARGAWERMVVELEARQLVRRVADGYEITGEGRKLVRR